MLSIIFHIFVYVKHFMHNYAVFYEYYALFMQAIKPPCLLFPEWGGGCLRKIIVEGNFRVT